jgi:hypothetical protein
MKKNELREWLGIAPADIPVWGAFILLGVMYFVKFTMVDIVLSMLAVGLTIFSCFIGMRYDERVSKRINLMKKISYPLCVVLCLVLIYLNFTRWNFQ